MEHLSPILATLDLKGGNLGPRIPAETICRAVPRTEIFGQVAPFMLRNRGGEAIIAAVRRDFAAVGGDGGLTVCAANRCRRERVWRQLARLRGACRNFVDMTVAR